ncbi:hypothetical protein [Streptomyces acidiscabies]|uniref:hypothetical protein n=1 Tax=Streptomyces acidiscabies TaxID=42234 RepID=UPI0009A130A0|nr:hypothetical protein [Streptomyces acidiscabies]
MSAVKWPRPEEVLENLPQPWPAPHPGCTRCAALAQERAQARRAGDGSRAVDCNVLIRRHDTDHASTP